MTNNTNTTTTKRPMTAEEKKAQGEAMKAGQEVYRAKLAAKVIELYQADPTLDPAQISAMAAEKLREESEVAKVRVQTEKVNGVIVSKILTSPDESIRVGVSTKNEITINGMSVGIQDLLLLAQPAS